MDKDPKTWTDAVRWTREYDARMERVKAEKVLLKQKDKDGKNTAKNTTTNTSTSKTTPSTSRTTTRGKWHWLNCKTNDHSFRECAKGTEKRCFNCGSKDHQ